MLAQPRLFDLPELQYVISFLLGLLPADEKVGGNDPNKAFVEYIGRKNGGMVPVFIRGQGEVWEVLYGGEIVKAARAANLRTVTVLIVPQDMEVNPADFAAYDEHGRMTIQEKVNCIMRVLSEEDEPDPKAIAKRVCLPVNEVKHLLALADGHQDIVKGWLAGQVSTTILKKVVRRPMNEQALYALHLNETGNLYEDDIKRIRAALSAQTAKKMDIFEENPDVSGATIVWNVRPVGDGIEVEISNGGEGRRKVIVPIGKLLELL